MSSLGNRTFQLTPQVSYTHIELFGSHRGSLTPMFQAFHLRGLTVPFLLRPTHINYIYFYVLNRETFIGRRPKYELTTHSSTLMMNDHIHAHTPNMLMSLCICNANVTANSHYMYDAHYMEHSNQSYFMSSTMQHISQAYKFHTFHANLYRYRSIMHISSHQYMTKQIMPYSLP